MPSPVPFRKVRKKLEQAGWRLDRVNGSHHIFKKQGHDNLIVPVHGRQVPRVYAKQVEREVESGGPEAGD